MLCLIYINFKSNADFSSLIRHFSVGVLVLHVDLGLGEVLCNKQLSLTNLEQVFLLTLSMNSSSGCTKFDVF